MKLLEHKPNPDVETVLRELAGNTMFSVSFTKRTNGQLRHMVCRFEVKRGVKGNPRYNASKHDLICVYDVVKRGYRMIPKEAIRRIKIRGVEYHFQGEEK